MENSSQPKDRPSHVEQWKEVFTEDRYPLIYEELIEKNRAFNRPVPLSLVVTMLYSMWKTQDWFPKENSKPKEETKCSIV